MNRALIYIVLLLLFVSVVAWLSKSSLFKVEEEYMPNEYEKSLIEYFKEIALNTEYDDNPERVIKWKQPISLFVHKEKDCIEQFVTLKETIAKLNNLVSDGFSINLTDDINRSNAVLYLTKKEKVKQLAPKFYELLADGMLGDYTGMTYVEFKLSNYVITKALIFINEEASIEEQKSAIVEEITQSIGLLNDSDKHSDSVFYESVDGIENIDYSEMDKDLIRFLYSENMIPGYREKSVELVIKRILRDRNKISNKKTQ